MNGEFLSDRGIEYRTTEISPDRLTLVFIHGLSGNMSAWNSYVQKYEKLYNVVIFDLRGHGRSKKYKRYEDYAIQKFADDLAGLLQHLKIGRFVLVSHSFGTIIALRYLLNHRSQIIGAVFLSPIFNVSLVPRGRLLRRLLALPVAIIRHMPLLKKRGVDFDYSPFLNTGDWNLRRLAADIGNTGLHAYFFCLRQLYDSHDDASLREIDVPVLVMHGEADTIMPIKTTAAIVPNISHCSFVRIPKANHILVLNNFTEVTNNLDDFLQTLVDLKN